MNRELKKFVFKVIGVAVSLAIAGGLLFYLLLPDHYLPVLPWLLVFFMIVTIIIHAWQLALAKKNMRRFMQTSMVATLIRLVLYSAVAIVYIAINSENIIPFVVSIAVFYLAFTYLEVADLSRILRERKK